jgi:ABC-2 type transport system ATP-binding protein
MDSDGIGELAFAAGITLHELSPTRGSLEEAFLQLTGEAVEYHAESGK